MSLRREKTDNLSSSRSDKEAKARKFKKKIIIPILSAKSNINKVTKERITTSRKTKNNKVLTPTSSSPRLFVKETDSDFKILSDSLSGLSETVSISSDQINNSHPEIKLNENKLPPTACDISNSKTTVFPVDISHQLVSDCNISVLSHRNNLDIKKDNKFISYESTFSALSTLPNTNIAVKENLHKNLESEGTVSPELQNSNLNNDSSVFDQISVVSADELTASESFCNLQDEAFSNDSISKKSSGLLFHRLISNAKPLLKPPNLTYEQNMFCCALDISLVKAVADECAYHTTSFPALLSGADCASVWQNNIMKPSDLPLNLLNFLDGDLNISNSEDNESEISISSCNTAVIQPEFFDLTFSDNPEKISESFQENSNVFCPNLGMNTNESLCIMPENEIPSDNVHVRPNILTPSTPPKKRKKRRYPFTRKRSCRKKKVDKNVTTTLKFEPSDELCDTCDETCDDAEDTLSDLHPSKYKLDAKKKENTKKQLSCNQLTKNSLIEASGPIQKTERYNLRRRCKKKEYEANVVKESLLSELCDTCDESDSEDFRVNNNQEKVGLVKAKDVESYGVHDKETYLVANKSDDRSLKNSNSSSKAEFPMLCNSKSLVINDLERDTLIHKHESKNVHFQKKELQNLKVKCSISLDKLPDSVKDFKRCVVVTDPDINDNTIKFSHKRRKVSSDETNQSAQIDYSSPNEMTVINSDKISEINQFLNIHPVSVVLERINLHEFIEISNIDEIGENVYIDKDFCRNSGITTDFDNISDTPVVEQFLENQNLESPSRLPNTYPESTKQISTLGEDNFDDSQLSNLCCEAFSPSKSKDISTYINYSNTVKESSCSSALSSIEIVNDENAKKLLSKSPVKKLSNIKMNSKKISKKPILKVKITRKVKNKNIIKVNNCSSSDINCNDNICLPCNLNSKDLKNTNFNFDSPLELREIDKDASTTKSVHSDEALILKSDNTALVQSSITSSVSPTEQNKSSYSKIYPSESKTEVLGNTSLLLGTSSRQKNIAKDEELSKNINNCTVSRNVLFVPEENIDTRKKMSAEREYDISISDTFSNSSDISHSCELDQNTMKCPENNANFSFKNAEIIFQNTESNIVSKSDSLCVAEAASDSVEQKEFCDSDILKSVPPDIYEKSLDKKSNPEELVILPDSLNDASEKKSKLNSRIKDLDFKNDDSNSCKKLKSLSERNLQLSTPDDGSSKVEQSAQSESSLSNEKNVNSNSIASLDSNFCDIQNNSSIKSPEKTRFLKKAKKNKVLEEKSSECLKQTKILKDIPVERQSKLRKIKVSESKSNLKEKTKKSLSETKTVGNHLQSSSKLPQNKKSIVLNSLVDDVDNVNKANLSEDKLKNVKNISEELSLEKIEDIVKVREENDGSVYKAKLCGDIQFSVQPYENCENSLDNSEPIILSLSDEELDPLENEDLIDNSSYSIEEQPNSFGVISKHAFYEHVNKVAKIESKASVSATDYENDEMFDILNNAPHYLSHGEEVFSEDDDSESDEERSFKRSCHEKRNNYFGEDIDAEKIKQNEVYRNSKPSSVNSDDCQKPNSVCESSKSSVCSEKSRVITKSVQRLEDVAVQIKELCDEDKVEEALCFAKTYMKISSSDSANKSILKYLLKSIFSYVRKYSGVKDFSSLAVFDKILNLIDNFNLNSKQFSSYYLVNCSLHPELNMCSMKMFDICQKKKIPLTIDAINAFSSFLKSGEIPLSQLLDYVDYVKNVCNKKIPKDITHLILEKSKACKSNEILRICSILNKITTKEVDSIVLEDFLVTCFKKSMWLYIAEMFVMWNKDKKGSLINSLLHALAVESENVGKYYGKFASAVHDLDEKELSYPGHKIAFGSIGVCLMLLAFEKNCHEIALEILDVLHRYNVNYFDLVETNWKFHVSLPNSVGNHDHTKTLPFYIVFVAIDICLHLKRYVDAFTIFQEFKWINPDNIFNEAVRSYVITERYQRLVKLTLLLNNKDTVDEGYQAMKVLVNAVEQDMTGSHTENNSDLDLKLKEKTPSVRSIYNKYLVNLMDTENMKYVSDLYRHSLGPKKDVFVLNPNVLRGLTVAFSNHAMDDQAKCTFVFGLVKNVYSVQMTEHGSFPWGITIRSDWTSPEIKLVIEWFVQTLFSLLLNRPKEENFENWFSMKIQFKKMDLKIAEGSFSNCLSETCCNVKDCIKRTKDALQNMNPSLQFIEKINEPALEVISNSLYNYYRINRCSDASLTSSLCSRPPFELKRKRFVFGGATFQFGDNISTSLNEAILPNETSFQVPSAENTISDWIDEIRANNSSPAYTPVSPTSSPYKVVTNVQDFSSSLKMHSDLQKSNNSPTDSSTPYKPILDKQQKTHKEKDLNVRNSYLFTSPKSVTYRNEKIDESKVAETNSLSYSSPKNKFNKTEELVTNKNLKNQTSECDLAALSCNTLPSNNLISLTNSKTLKSNSIFKKKEVIKTPKVAAKIPKNNKVKKTRITDLKNLTISFAASSNNRIVSDSPINNNSPDLVIKNPITSQSMSMNGTLRKFKRLQDSKRITQAAKSDIIKPNNRNLKADTLLVKTFTQNNLNPSKITDVSNILVKITGPDPSAQKVKKISKEYTSITHSSDKEVCKSSGKGGNDGNSFCLISNDTADKTTCSANPFVPNKSFKPKIMRDFGNANKNTTCPKTTVTLQPERTDHHNIHMNHTSFELEKKGQNVHTNKRLKRSENVAQKTEISKLPVSGSLCSTEQLKIVTFLKTKVTQKCKHLSPEGVHQYALELAQKFIHNYKDFKSLDSRAMKLLMEFTMSNV